MKISVLVNRIVGMEFANTSISWCDIYFWIRKHTPVQLWHNVNWQNCIRILYDVLRNARNFPLACLKSIIESVDFSIVTEYFSHRVLRKIVQKSEPLSHVRRTKFSQISFVVKDQQRFLDYFALLSDLVFFFFVPSRFNCLQLIVIIWRLVSFVTLSREKKPTGRQQSRSQTATDVARKDCERVGNGIHAPARFLSVDEFGFVPRESINFGRDIYITEKTVCVSLFSSKKKRQCPVVERNIAFATAFTH